MGDVTQNRIVKAENTTSIANLVDSEILDDTVSNKRFVINPVTPDDVTIHLNDAFDGNDGKKLTVSGSDGVEDDTDGGDIVLRAGQGKGTGNHGSVVVVSPNYDNKQILALKENGGSGKECFEVQSIGGIITVVPRERNSDAINAAIKYLQGLESGEWSPSGGIVFLPGGEPYEIDSPIDIGEGDGGAKCGNGIQLVGDGAFSTILKIDSQAAISAIRIQGISGYYSQAVVIRDLQITMVGDEDNDRKHTGIENIRGTNCLVQNVRIVGSVVDPVVYYLRYGIKATGWTNVYHSCVIANVSEAGIYLTAEGANYVANASQIVDCGIAGFIAFSSENAYGILVENGLNSNIIGCTIGHTGCSAVAGKNIGIGVGENAEETLIKGNYIEEVDIGIELKSNGHTIIGGGFQCNPALSTFLKIEAPAQADGNIVMNIGDINSPKTRFYGNVVFGDTGSEEGSRSVGKPTEKLSVLGNADIASPDVLGPESLNNNDFSSGSSYWTASNPNLVNIMDQ